jgi:hypothetical protein
MGGFKQNKDRALMEVVSVFKDSLTWRVFHAWLALVN